MMRSINFFDSWVSICLPDSLCIFVRIGIHWTCFTSSSPSLFIMFTHTHLCTTIFVRTVVGIMHYLTLNPNSIVASTTKHTHTHTHTTHSHTRTRKIYLLLRCNHFFYLARNHHLLRDRELFKLTDSDALKDRLCSFSQPSNTFYFLLASLLDMSSKKCEIISAKKSPAAGSPNKTSPLDSF